MVRPPDPDIDRHGGAVRNRFAGLTGTLAAGLVVLAVLVLAAQAWGWLAGHPGPGVAMVAGHVLAAVFAVAAQRVADRERGTRAAACQLVVGLLALGVLTLLWWL